MTYLLWITVPYIAFTSFVLGHIWRYRNDQFGWTTRSSQLYESRLLRLGSPLFHFGILGVIMGHILGLLVPESWTEDLDIPESVYHMVSLVGGLAAGVATVAGIAILAYRRITVRAVHRATSGLDKLMYPMLIAALVTGMANTIGPNMIGGGYDYRQTVAPWLRGLLRFDPQPDLMVHAPLTYQIHGVVVMILLGIWPYTRLVHMFSAPIGYLVRPYVVYRSKDTGTARTRYARAWET